MASQIAAAKSGTVAAIFTAVGTVSVAVLAIWGDYFRYKYAGPTLELRLNDASGDLIPRNDGTKCLLLSFENKKRSTVVSRDRCACDGGAVETALEGRPLIFITPSWIPALSEDALLAHKRGYRPGDLRFHKNGQAVDTQLELRVASEEEDYDLIVSAPSLLLESAETRALIEKTFYEFLRGRKWLLEEML